jgi:cytochrome c-type biogenesis protein
MEATAPSLGLAFLAGLASFLSPCVFALVPAYISYLGGRSAATATQKQTSTWYTLRHGLAFVLGFSTVFILLGLLSSALGALLYDFSWWLTRVGGIVVILFGLHLTGLIRIPFLDFDLRIQSDQSKPRSYLSSAMMGVFFSAGWSPCVGPILGAILTLTLNGGSVISGTLLLAAYSAGLAIPFLLAATQISWVTFLLRRYAKLSLYIERALGAVLILVGALLFSGRFSTLASLGFFFDIFDEARVGGLLLIAFVISLLVGLVPAWWAARRKRPFVESWFLASGASFLILLVLFLLGVFPPLMV